MDYGQPKNNGKVTGIFSGAEQYQEPTNNSYFTAGIGNQSPASNDFESENNLDEENWQRSLEISTPVDLPSPEKLTAPIPIGSEAARMPQEEPKLGEITPVATSTVTQATPTNYNPLSVRTTGDHLEKTTIKEVDNVFDKLNQTGDLNNFYNEIRGTDGNPGMYEANLHNSYGRKIGEGI